MYHFLIESRAPLDACSEPDGEQRGDVGPLGEWGPWRRSIGGSVQEGYRGNGSRDTGAANLRFSGPPENRSRVAQSG